MQSLTAPEAHSLSQIGVTVRIFAGCGRLLCGDGAIASRLRLSRRAERGRRDASCDALGGRAGGRIVFSRLNDHDDGHDYDDLAARVHDDDHNLAGDDDDLAARSHVAQPRERSRR